MRMEVLVGFATSHPDADINAGIRSAAHSSVVYLVAEEGLTQST